MHIICVTYRASICVMMISLTELGLDRTNGRYAVTFGNQKFNRDPDGNLIEISSYSERQNDPTLRR